MLANTRGQDKKNTNSTQNKSETHHAKQYEVTSFLSTDCELSTETCSKNVYSLGPRSQLLPDRLGIYLKLFVSTYSTPCHEFAFRFGLAFLLYAKNTQHYRGDRISRKGLLNNNIIGV